MECKAAKLSIRYFAIAMFLAGICLNAATYSVVLPPIQSNSGSLGTYFFGFGAENEDSGIWPCNFWSNFDINRIRQDAAQFKMEGGSSVILLFPHFDTGGDLAAQRFRELKTILGICSEFHLTLSLRLGYAWDNGYTDQAQERQIGILVDPEQRKSWYAFCTQTYLTSVTSPAFRGAFISWEDYWSILAGASFDEAGRKKWAKRIFYPDAIVPAREAPEMESFFDYVDRLFSDDFFTESQKHFPDLGMEVRMDDDPIYVQGKAVRSYVHKRQFSARGLKNVYFYWGPFMGAPNSGDLISADTACDLLSQALTKIKNLAAADAHPILAQFNFKDNTPGFSQNSRIQPEELPDFITKSAMLLGRSLITTYTWSNVSYYHNALNNGTFSRGAEFWRFRHSLVGLHGNDAYVSIFAGGEITQPIAHDSAISSGLIGSSTAEVSFFAKAPAESSCTVTLGSQKAEVVVKGDERWQRYAVKFQSPAVVDTEFRLSARQSVMIRGIVLANHKQNIGATEPAFHRDSLYADLAWSLNRGRQDSAVPTFISGITADQWIDSGAILALPAKAGRYHVKISIQVPAFIMRQSVKIFASEDPAASREIQLPPGSHEILLSGSTSGTQALLTFELSTKMRPSHSEDVRELAAHIDGMSE